LSEGLNSRVIASIRARLVGAITQAVLEVLLRAQTTEIAIAAAELSTLVQHVVDACCLEMMSVMIPQKYHYSARGPSLTPHAGNPLGKDTCAVAAAARLMAAMTAEVFIALIDVYTVAE
jgi:hypothetical protein